MNTPKKEINNRIQKIKTYWYWFILGCSVLLYTVVFSYYSILRHNTFASGFDLANADQTVWNTLYGHFFSLSTNGQTMSRLTIHADFILILLTPFYLLWNNVRMLLVVQSLFLAIGAIPVFLLARQMLKNNVVALALVFVYLFNPNLHWTNMYDFHGITIAIPLLLWTFYFAYKKRWRWYIIFAFLAILTKEEISLVIAMVGIYLIFYLHEKKIGFLSIIFGFCWFVVIVFFVMPNFRGGQQHWAFSWYQLSSPENDDNQDDTSIIKTVIHRLFFANDIPQYYFSLVKPFGIFPPVLRLPELMLAAPEIAINTLSTHAEMRGTLLHYDSGITPFLIISTIFSLSAITTFTRKQKKLARFSPLILYGLTLYLIIISLRVNIPNTPLPYSPNCWCRMYKITNDEKNFEKILSSIPKNASVTSSSEIRPHLTHRVESFNLPQKIYDVDYIALIDQNRIVGNYESKDFERKLIGDLAQSNRYTLIAHVGHFYLYKKVV